MEEAKRRRGRPKLDAHITEDYALSRRQALNKMYMYEGVYLLSVAITEIPDRTVLWSESQSTQTLTYVQLFRDCFTREMLAQDEASQKAELTQKRKALSGAQKRMEDLDKIIQRLYEDSVSGKLSDTRFQKLSAQYDAEHAWYMAGTGRNMAYADIRFIKGIRRRAWVRKNCGNIRRDWLKRMLRKGIL